MAKPTTWITGARLTPSGATVIAGRIEAVLYPPGVVGLDTTAPTSLYKFSGHRAIADITSSVITSLVLVQTTSLSHAQAFYVARTMSSNPVGIVWEEMWRVDTILGSLSVGLLTVLGTTPYMDPNF